LVLELVLDIKVEAVKYKVLIALLGAIVVVKRPWLALPVLVVGTKGAPDEVGKVLAGRPA
jgi:hypothetical protein